MFYRINKKIKGWKNAPLKSIKLNLAITSGHICLILCYTLASFFTFNLPYSNGSKGNFVSAFRASSAWTFIGGLCDLFLTCMIWFIFDEEQSPSFIADGNNSYAVINVLQASQHSISYDDSDSEHGEVDDSIISIGQSQFMRISDLMIRQFFDKSEGPERFWRQSY